MTTMVAPPSEQETIASPIAPVATAELPPTPQATPWSEPAPLPPTDHRRSGGVLAGVILVALGIVFLAGNLLPTGGLLFLGLGAAFLVARVMTGQPGFAVPAGILLAFGAFVALTETDAVAGRDTGGLFFMLLGLGFIGSYVIAAHPARVWPLLPAAALIGFGLFVQGVLSGWPFEQLVWLAAYWPLALIIFGVWLLVRDQLPGPWRVPLTIVGVSGLIVVGFLVAAAGVASVAVPGGRFAPFPAWPGIQTMPMFGTPPLQDTIVLNAPIAAGDTLRLSATSGRTTVRPTTGDQVRVEAVRHYWSTGYAPDVTLVPRAGTLSIELSRPFSVPGNMGYVDYVIELPAASGADIGATSGDVTVSGLAGPVSLHTVSGSIVANDLTGDVQLTTTSGSIRGTNVDRVREARTVSGGIDLIGAFASDATVASTSGGIALQFEPGASVRVAATTTSGGIRTSGPGMPGPASDARTRSLTLGSGAASVQVRTTSGGISLTAR